MELKDTTKLMCSDDYKDRFRAEYYQLAIRTKRLYDMLKNWDNLTFKPDCHKAELKKQFSYMHAYMKTLERRAHEEKIELQEV